MCVVLMLIPAAILLKKMYLTMMMHTNTVNYQLATPKSSEIYLKDSHMP